MDIDDNVTEYDDLFKDYNDRFSTDFSNKSTQVRPFLLTSDAKNDYLAIIYSLLRIMWTPKWVPHTSLITSASFLTAWGHRSTDCDLPEEHD